MATGTGTQTPMMEEPLAAAGRTTGFGAATEPAPHRSGAGGHARSRMAAMGASAASSALAVCLLVPVSAARAKDLLNDTGQTQCLAEGTVDWIACEGTGQDGALGRDLKRPSPKNGQAGFAFVKVGADGVARGPLAQRWACVTDRVTGLMWEVKTDDGGLHDAGKAYTNHGDGRAGDASAFVQAVNATGLCGHQDWRLPSRLELQGLVHYGRVWPAASVDTDWFPNTPAQLFWSGTGQAGGRLSAWSVSFDGGSVTSDTRNFRLPVRLVRGEPAPQQWVAKGAEVTDMATGLVWRRCVEGQTWTGSQCSGSPSLFGFHEALAWSLAVAAGGTPWRLPSAKELSSLVDDRRVAPAIDPVFDATPTQLAHWSSSHQVSSLSNAWGVEFNRGWLLYGYRSAQGVVRLVRDAP